MTFRDFLLHEAAKALSDLQANGMFVVFRPTPESVSQALEQPAQNVEFMLQQGRQDNPRVSKHLGAVEMDMPRTGDDKPHYGLQVYATHSYAPHGYGPLLYDLAAEYAYLHGFSVMAASGVARLMSAKGLDYERGETSPEAQGLWRGYAKRPDVRRGVGGPGWDVSMLSQPTQRPLRKPTKLLYELSRLGLIVDMAGRPVDFTGYG
jgi:hypothetical protein